MAINIQNIIAALEAKVAAATSATETQELIVIIKSIKAAGQQTIVTYADVPNLPIASADNAGNLAYVAAVGKIYYSNGTTWTEVGSGSSGGTAYDQSLNTTDDVVFNSSLIGDVSIIGNEISGTDAYGNDATLVLNSPVEFKTTETTGSAVSLDANPNNLSTSNDQVYLGNFASYNAGFQAVQISEIPAGTLVTTNALFNPSTYETLIIRFEVSSTQLQYDPYNPSSVIGVSITTVPGTLNYSLDNGSTWRIVQNTSYYEYYNQTIGRIVLSYDTTSIIDKTVVSVTESGVNVEGTLTVNGLPVGAGGSGSSYDQSLNTTDDVVFNSALVGDVSIIGNEISGTDAYGNNSELLINAPLTVQSDSLIEAVITTSVYGAAGYYQATSSAITINSSDVNEFISSLSQGEQFSFELISDTGYTFTGTANFNYSQANYYGGTDVYVTNLVSNAQNSNEFFLPNSKLFKGSIVQPLTVTATGVNVDGTFTVNGQPVAGGSGSSFDQDLNTTDDVVFNSALVGDVSIIGNEISGVDAYGNSDTLVMNSPVEFKNTANTIVTNALQFGSSFTQFSMNSFNIYLQSQPNDVIANAIALDAIPAGTQIQFQFYDNGSYSNKLFRFTLNNVNLSYDRYNPSLLEYVYIYPQGSVEYSTDGGVSWQFASGTEYFGGGTSATASYSASSTVIQTVASVTETGLNVSNINSTDLNVKVGEIITATNTVIPTFSVSPNWIIDSASGKPYFLFGNLSADAYTQYFKAGMTVTIWGEGTPSGKGEQYTITLLSDMSYSNLYAGSYAAETAEVPPYGFSSITLYNEFVTSLTTGSEANYAFDDQGAFTTPNIIAETALIGDVSVVANTISAVDSYGNADTLVVDGDLSVKHTTQSVVTYTNLNWGGATVGGMFVGAPSQLVFSDYGSLDSNTESILTSLTVGQQISFIDNDSIQRTYTVVSASTALGMGGTDVIVNLQEPYGGAYIQFTTNKTLTVTSLVTKTSSFTSEGLTLDGNVSFENELTFKTTVPQSNVVNLNIGSASVYYGMGTIYVQNLSNYQTEALQLDSIPSGTLVTLYNLYDYSAYQNVSIRFVVNTSSVSTDPYNPGTITSVNFSSPTLTESSIDGGSTWSSLDLYTGSATLSSQGGNFTATYIGESIVVKNVASITDNGIVTDNTLVKALGPIGSDNSQPTAYIGGGLVTVQADNNSPYSSRTQISPTSHFTAAVVPGTLADGGSIERRVIGEKTGGVNTPSYPSQIDISLSAATLNGDISLIEVTISAINVSGTPPALAAKSWKIRGYATKLDNVVSFTQIGTTEVLATIDPTQTGGLNASVSVLGTSGNIALSIGEPTTGGYKWTWGGEVTIITTHQLVNTGTGGGK